MLIMKGKAAALTIATVAALAIAACDGRSETATVTSTITTTVAAPSLPPVEEARTKPKDEVDLDALRTELIELHGAQTAINMDEWYDLVVQKCDDDLSEWRMAIALSIDQGLTSLNDLYRTSMKHICPGREPIVDAAIAEVQKSNQEANLACSLPRGMRTSQQQSLAEALGCA